MNIKNLESGILIRGHDMTNPLRKLVSFINGNNFNANNLYCCIINDNGLSFVRVTE